MSGLRRPLGLVLALSLFSTPVFAASPDKVGDAFAEGVQMLQRGRDDDALRAFQRVLSLDPSSERALQLWQGADSGVVMDLLTKGGEFEKVGRAILGLVRAGRVAMRDDADTIRGLLATLVSGGVADRREALYRLTSDHGEFAVPYMLRGLADRADDDKRVAYLHALSEMGGIVVLPLIAALESPDEYVRRNVAITLGLIGDRRAGAALAHLAATDDVSGPSAREALGKLGTSGSAPALYASLGRSYLTGAADGSHRASNVIWSWGEGGLESTEVPSFLYGAELAAQSFFGGLAASGASLNSRAGVALASAAVAARIEAAGDDASDWSERAASARMAVAAAGPDAVDAALTRAMDLGDAGAAILLARSLGETARTATSGLEGAVVQTESAGLRGEAAVSLARIAVRNGQSVAGAVVSALGEAAARRSLRVAAIIDGEHGRARSTADHLREMGVSAYSFGSGGKALVGLRRLPGVDVVLLADSLPDITADEVLDAIRDDARLGETPVLILSQDAERADELYGEKSQGIVTSNAELAQVTEVMSEPSGDRARAVELARRAAMALASLASTGTNLSGVAEPLASALDGSDELVASALYALRACGGARQADAVAAVLGDEDRSEVVRVAAAVALGGIFDRAPTASDETRAVLQEVGMNADSDDLRGSALQALGRLDLSSEARTTLLGSLR